MRGVTCGAALALLLSAGCSHDPVTPVDTGVTTDTVQAVDTARSEGGIGGDQTVVDAAPDAVVKLDLPTGCSVSKIGFTQANPSKFELWELCFTAGDTATEALIKKIDPTVTCRHSAGGMAAKCPTGTWRCMSALDRDPVTKAVTAGAWTKLCQLSVLPAVSKIAGGHYI